MGRSFYLATKDSDLVAGSQSFSDLINASPTTYGLTAPIAASYQVLNDDFAARYQLTQQPATRTKVSIVGRNDARILLVQKASEIAKTIYGTPTVTDEQKSELGLSVRAAPAPAPAPGTCNDFKVMLLADGSVEIRWKANNPPRTHSVTYQLWRRIGSVGEFSFLGACGVKKFVDSTIPAGTVQAQYQIRGIRPTAAGEWAQFNVNFGQAASGIATASIVETAVAPKIAA